MPLSSLPTNPAMLSEAEKLKGADVRVNPFTIITVPFSLLLRYTDSISEGKLKPPSFAATILKLYSLSFSIAIFALVCVTTKPLSKSLSSVRVYTIYLLGFAVGSLSSNVSSHLN